MRSRIFRVDPKSRAVEELQPTKFSNAGFLETKDIHEWLANNTGILGEDLLIIQREHVGVEGSRRRPDILAIDTEGNLVVVEVKRDDSGIDVYWQATLYAASYWTRSGSDLIEMFSSYTDIEEPEAVQRLIDHTGSEDKQDLLTKLNKKQRIVLASGTFPKEVTTAVLWLREHGVDISCLQLTPHHDQTTDTHYLQSTYVIPVPETKDLMVELRKTQQERAVQEADISSRQNDNITKFMSGVYEQLKSRLNPDLVPSKSSRWAGTWYTTRYFKFWYEEWPWANHNFCFAAELETEEGNRNVDNIYANFSVYTTDVRARGVSEDQINQLKTLCKKFRGENGLDYKENQASFYLGKWTPTDELSQKGAEDTAAAVAQLIEVLVPEIRSIVQADRTGQPAPAIPGR